MRVRLPIFINDKLGSLVWFLIGGAATLLLYRVTNRTTLLDHSLLPMTAIDKSVPFIPWTIWVYFTEYLVFIASWVWLTDHKEQVKYWYSYMAILIVSIIVFVVFPTTFPRDDFPLTGFAPSVNIEVFRFFRAHMDMPANCLPSLHVSSCYIAAMVFWRVSKPKFWLFFIWATFVAISTMTTKQHYFIDIWTAFILCLVSYYYFYNYVDYYQPAKEKLSAAAKAAPHSVRIQQPAPVPQPIRVPQPAFTAPSVPQQPKQTIGRNAEL